MNPIDYTINVANPMQSALQGYQQGLAIKDDLAQREAQQQMQEEFARLASNPNAKSSDYSSMMVRYPQLSEHFKRSWDVLSGEQQQNSLNQATQVHSALIQGQTAVAAQLLQNQIDGYINSGQQDKAQATTTLKKLIELDPSMARTVSGLNLASIMGADKFSTAFGQIGQEERSRDLAPSQLVKSQEEAQAAKYDTQIKGYQAANEPTRIGLENSKSRAEIQNIDSMIDDRVARFKLDKDKMQSEIEMQLYKLNPANNLDEGAKKLINESTVDSVAASQKASSMIDLANKLDAVDAGSGMFSRGWESVKSMTGNQDAMSQLRQEYTRLRNSSVSSMLKGQGAITDSEREQFLKGFMPETANSKQLASFVRTLAKVQQVEAASKAAQAEWVNSVGHLGKPKQDVEIQGIKVPAGTTFEAFSSQYIGKMANERMAQQSVSAVGNRSYMQHAQLPESQYAKGIPR